jgi:transposase-like protein
MGKERVPSRSCERSTGGRAVAFSAEEKIRIVLEGFPGEESAAEPCRREGLVSNLCSRWSKELLEAGKSDSSGINC